MLQPSKTEGFGMPVLEAQLLGTPVITTRFGAMADLDALILLGAKIDSEEEKAEGTQFRSVAPPGKFLQPAAWRGNFPLQARSTYGCRLGSVRGRVAGRRVAQPHSAAACNTCDRSLR